MLKQNSSYLEACKEWSNCEVCDYDVGNKDIEETHKIFSGHIEN